MTDSFLNTKSIINTLTRILSIGIKYSFSNNEIENRIKNSPFFQSLENDDDRPLLYTDEKKIIKSVFYEDLFFDISDYIECSWVSEMIINIYLKTSLTFEAIFIYFPLNNFYQSFTIYHEMDSSQFLNNFLSIIKKNNILSLLLKRKHLTSQFLANKTSVSLPLINALRSGKRDISKMEFAKVVLISKVLGVRSESLLTYNSETLIKYRMNIKYSFACQNDESNRLIDLINKYFEK